MIGEEFVKQKSGAIANILAQVYAVPGGINHKNKVTLINYGKLQSDLRNKFSPKF